MSKDTYGPRGGGEGGGDQTEMHCKFAYMATDAYTYRAAGWYLRTGLRGAARCEGGDAKNIIAAIINPYGHFREQGS